MLLCMMYALLWHYIFCTYLFLYLPPIASSSHTLSPTFSFSYTHSLIFPTLLPIISFYHTPALIHSSPKPIPPHPILSSSYTLPIFPSSSSIISFSHTPSPLHSSYYTTAPIFSSSHTPSPSCNYSSPIHSSSHTPSHSCNNSSPIHSSSHTHPPNFPSSSSIISSSYTSSPTLSSYSLLVDNVIFNFSQSERAKQTEATGDRFTESKNINKSLLTLGNVIKGEINI